MPLQSPDARLFEAVLIAMVRSGHLPPAVLEQVADEFEQEAAQRHGSSGADEAEMLARKARGIILEASGPTLADWLMQRRR